MSIFLYPIIGQFIHSYTVFSFYEKLNRVFSSEEAKFTVSGVIYYNDFISNAGGGEDKIALASKHKIRRTYVENTA
jgi:hypothetical protein